MEPIIEETKAELKPVVVVKEAKPTYNVRTGELIQTDKSKMANTFPEWWGHQESEPHPVVPPIRKEEPKVVIKTLFNQQTEENNSSKAQKEQETKPHEDKQDAYGSSWISCKYFLCV